MFVVNILQHYIERFQDHVDGALPFIIWLIPQSWKFLLENQYSPMNRKIFIISINDENYDGITIDESTYLMFLYF